MENIKALKTQKNINYWWDELEQAERVIESDREDIETQEERRSRALGMLGLLGVKNPLGVERNLDLGDEPA
ncbi:MAG: hypothetical protein EOO17_00850 [Chloroflexi bacterium]|nr:MAG: hypothetical protein EOO17_00850 [Chloroflexota bacterium]